MDALRLTIGRTLLPIAPFIAVIIVPNLVSLNGSIHDSPTESRQDDRLIIDLQWRLGPYVLSSSTTNAVDFIHQANCSTLEEAGSASLLLEKARSVTLLRTRSLFAVCIFLIALVVSVVIGRVSHWHSCVTVPSSRYYPPLQTVGACLGILCVCVVGFVLLKPLWPPGVSELIRWLRFSVAGVIPFISIVIVTPVSEELVFRSGVCRLLVERIGPVAGIFLQAVLFGSVHLATPLHMAVGFIGGIVLGWVYIYSRSLNASIFLHAGANCVLAMACLTIA